MKIEGSLFDNSKADVRTVKTSIYRLPTQTFNADNVKKPRFEELGGRSQIFMSGAPKKSEVESALFISGAPVVRNKGSGFFNHVGNAAPRSSIEQKSNGYTWQQYMPFGTGIWEKQSKIPTKSSTTLTTIASNAHARNFNSNNGNNFGRDHSYLRDGVYNSDNRRMLPASSLTEGANVAQEVNDGARFALQRQSSVDAVSSGGILSMAKGSARSGVEGNKDQGNHQDAAQPTRAPAMPNTELGIPQVIASDPTQKAIPMSLSMFYAPQLYDVTMRDAMFKCVRWESFRHLCYNRPGLSSRALLVS